MSERSRRSTAFSGGLFAFVVTATVSAVVGGPATGMSFAVARDSFLIPNVALGFGCGACGLLIARHRPGNRVGWLLLGAGVCQSLTAGVTPWLVRALTDASSPGLERGLGTLYSLGWPWSVSLFVPLTLLMFPDGQLLSRRWRWLPAVAAVNAVVQVLTFSSDPNSTGLRDQLGLGATQRGRSWLGLPDSVGLDVLGWVSHGLLATILLAALASLGLRYRRGDEQRRRQLLWLMLATAVTTAVIVASRATTEPDPAIPALVLTLTALIPVSMAVAVLRYQVLDIRLVWSRAVSYGLLTAVVVGVYLGLVEIADLLLRRQLGSGTPVVAALGVAVGFNPARFWLQGRVDHLLYGERADPIRAASSITTRLAIGAQSPADVLPAVGHALRLPYAALTGDGTLLGEYGERAPVVEGIPLFYAGEQLGELIVGVRSGQRRLAPADRAVLELLAAPMGVALRATALSATVQRSREQIVAAREEERRRLRRDLHDGLGPVLTGIAFQADAIGNFLATDPDRAGQLAENIRVASAGAIEEVRRLIYHLRPAALDELGLVEAVRRHAEQLQRRSDNSPLTISVRAPAPLPDLPAAVEVTAYRIVTEALTNAARHSQAGRVEVDFAECADVPALLLTVQDDGARANGGGASGWRSGVGLDSMRERVAELGGSVEAGPTVAGGRVYARLPIGARR